MPAQIYSFLVERYMSFIIRILGFRLYVYNIVCFYYRIHSLNFPIKWCNDVSLDFFGSNQTEIVWNVTAWNSYDF